MLLAVHNGDASPPSDTSRIGPACGERSRGAKGSDAA